MAEELLQLLIADSSVLINFFNVGRPELLTGLPYRVLIADVVRDEIQRRHQLEQLEEAIQAGSIEVVSLEDPTELQAVARLRSAGLGTGESVSIVAAEKAGAILAVDDGKATKTAVKAYPKLRCTTTQALIVENIQQGVLTVEEADALKEEWHLHHRFTLKLTSFGELVSS